MTGGSWSLGISSRNPTKRCPSISGTASRAITKAIYVGDEPRAFDETQLARRWDISVRTLQQWRRMGIGPIYLKLGNRVSYRREDIEQYERQALRRGTGERAFT